VWSAAQWSTEIRDVLDAALGYAVDYDATPEGDWTAAVGSIASQTEQGLRIGVDGLNPITATGSTLDAAVSPVVFRRPATRSRYTVEVVTASTLPTGALYRDTSARSWSVVAGGVFGVGDDVILEAVDAGPIALSQGAPSTLTPITALVTPTDLTYTPGDTYSVGRAVEADSTLRRRWSVSLGRPNGPTGPGITRTIRAIPWVTACSPVRTGPGQLSIYVVPGPVGADQETELGEAIYACAGASTVLAGTDSVAVEGADGRGVTVYWTPGDTVTVDVQVVVTMRTGLVEADYTEAIADAVGGVFDALEVGSTLYRNDLLTAVWQIGAYLTVNVLLNGGTANIAPPTATDILVLGTLT
jgi:hypothetical protein